ncbi:MAG: T9SS type A sorting domain-containing protein [Bacteroidia bacterium]
MKKIFTSLFVLAIATFGFSQSLHIYNSGVDVTGDTVIVPITAGSTNLNDLEIHNTTTSIINFQCNRTITPIDSCANVYYCTGVQCYSPHTQTTWTPTDGGETIGASAVLPSGPGTYGISAHYDACASFCNDIYVLYRVYNRAASTNDTARVILHYMCATGINEAEQAIVNSNAYPNPANSSVTISYEMKEQYNNGKIVFYDMLGKSVKQVAIADKQGNMKVDVSGLNDGIYFYSIVVDSKAIVTKKLIVSSK